MNHLLFVPGQAIQNAGDTAYWTKLNWKSNCKSGGNLRLIVTSKKVVMGSVNFSSDDLLNAISDDRGLRRVSLNLSQPPAVSASISADLSFMSCSLTDLTRLCRSSGRSRRRATR